MLSLGPSSVSAGDADSPRPGSDTSPLAAVDLNASRLDAPSTGGGYDGRLPSPEHAFRVGDMVWGKVKSHPWWPGQIFSESFAATSVRRSKSAAGQVLVAFFGDSSYGWFEPAELIPFSPNLLEKSVQTNSRSFVRAVEEAVDELQRRAALSISCRCRNASNFQAVPSAPGYYLVDVPGYEPSAFYSVAQISEAQDMFDPAVAASFLRMMAIAPTTVPMNDGDVKSKIAMMMAYRRATYEEFDDTYAEAFGVDPSRLPPAEKKRDFARRGVPLSGQLVIAEKHDESVTKNGAFAGIAATPVVSASGAKPKKGTKKSGGEFLLKRRCSDDVASAAVGSLPLLPSLPNGTVATLQFSPDDGNSDGGAQNFVLQKRAVDSGLAAEVRFPVKEPRMRHQTADGVAVLGDEDVRRTKKKRKKTKSVDGLIPTNAAPKKPIAIPLERRRKENVGFKTAAVADIIPMPAAYPKLPEVLDDLRDLAVCPFHGADQNSSTAAFAFFHNFRSLVYQKSIVVASPGDVDSPDSRPVKASKQSSEQRSLHSVPDQLKRDQPKKITGLKRGPSDRQEELALKKEKKMKQIKALTSEKKAAAVDKKGDEPLPDQHKGSMSASAAPGKAAIAVSQTKAMKTEQLSLRKQEPLAPTALMMKFPPKTALPSNVVLHARLARFGNIDTVQTRVYWRTHTCKVVFNYKSDAQAALSYLKRNESTFGAKGTYYVKAVEGANVEQSISIVSPRLDGARPLDVPLLKPSTTAGNLQPGALPKSILKKPGDDSSLASGGTIREAPRVKFMLDDTSKRAETPASALSSNVSGNSNVRSSALPTSESLVIPNSKSASLPPPPAPASFPASHSFGMPHMALQLPPLTEQTQSYRPAVPNSQSYHPVKLPGPTALPRAALRFGEGLYPMQTPPASEPQTSQPVLQSEKPTVDIGEKLMRLLLVCYEQVNRINESAGEPPYHRI